MDNSIVINKSTEKINKFISDEIKDLCKIIIDNNNKLNDTSDLEKEIEIQKQNVIEKENQNSELKKTIIDMEEKIKSNEELIEKFKNDNINLENDIRDLKKVSLISKLTKELEKKNLEITKLKDKIGKKQLNDLKCNKSLNDSQNTSPKTSANTSPKTSANTSPKTSPKKLSNTTDINISKNSQSDSINNLHINVESREEEVDEKLNTEKSEEVDKNEKLQEEPLVSDDEEEIYEVKYRKKTYYVKEDLVYVKNEDESIGKKVGKYINNKVKLFK